MKLPLRQSEVLRRMKEPDRYLTAEAVERLKRQLDRLIKIDRPKGVIELTTTREMGDLSENAGYSIAKANLSRMDNRILTLEDRIKNAIVIQADESGIAQIGSNITIKGPMGQKTYQILGVQEVNPMQNKLSYLSPLGVALMGKKAGDTFKLNTPAGEQEYEIILVE